jgi:hypothetical protein
LIRRPWVSVEKQPYKKTCVLRPGESWFQAPTTDKQWESYARNESGGAVPVGALIAQELSHAGASFAVFTELWGARFVLVGPDLVCSDGTDETKEIIAEIKARNGGSLAGFPDVMGLMPQGRIAFREAKSIANKDRLTKSQHAMADMLRRVFGARLDLAVVVWDAR